jgi:uncharacterized protein
MSKFLIVAGLVLVVYWWLSGRLKRGRDAGTKAPGAPAAPTAMVRCAHCGVHLPGNEALFDDRRLPYCGEPHRVAGPKPGAPL